MTTSCKSGPLRVGEIYTSCALGLKPHKIPPRILVKTQHFRVVYLVYLHIKYPSVLLTIENTYLTISIKKRFHSFWPLDVQGHLPVVLLDSHELLPEPQETAPHARLLRLPQLKVRLPHLIVITATYWNRQACLLTKLLYVNVNKTNSSNLIIMESLNLKGVNFQFWIDNFYRGFLIFLKFWLWLVNDSIWKWNIASILIYMYM